RIDLDVRPGETVAIVGVTGSGKTTLVSLVPRLYDVSSGRISIDGRDVRDFTLDSLRCVVGMAFEEATLFSMSVRENLTLGRPDASDEEVDEALSIAQARFAYELPWGSTRAWASRGCRCRVGSASGWRSREPSSGGRACWFSTIRCPRSTCTPRRSS